MLAIPVPFVVSLLLLLLAVTLYVRLPQQAKAACAFLLLCSLTTATVGLRWTLDWSWLRFLQPVLAATIPAAAWSCFFIKRSNWRKVFSLHWLGPSVVVLALLAQPIWSAPLDEWITLLYVAYGIALIRRSREDWENIALGEWEDARKAALVAGAMLLFSALIDSAMSIDFAFRAGKEALYILTIGHLIMLPLLSLAVVMVGISTPVEEEEAEESLIQPTHGLTSISELPVKAEPLLSAERALEITQLLDQLMLEKKLYLDPELTLNKLSRKLVIPAKQISTAVNLVHQRNISKLINEYRIEHAKQALRSCSDTITQIMLSSGFQTKSNFNREFSRITGTTPSDYREQTQRSPS
ncbi:helix-turn-helix domain-containing protein [Vibrio porteresiae]|uniref:Helix-turn-helix domain-containing protein n=1 Tax=Vibrio porteresiae DSM 19223 TaxID=1123496 RepID=A0ABZ0QKD0_9VIBR|nr:helix-turn-helix domain-containing protein [Vibrio porteresiae]WPC76973.1 helix-turn-helix domain-containing protein [Vibrio porteresiae DSM 19223]